MMKSFRMDTIKMCTCEYKDACLVLTLHVIKFVDDEKEKLINLFDFTNNIFFTNNFFNFTNNI